MSGGDAATVLVVDDNELNRDLLSRRLRRDGHEVAIAVDGQSALDALAAAPYDLVLLDIMMPGLSGYEVLERMKGDERLRHVPVIMITAVDDAASVVRCVALGAEDHLPKPFDPGLLRARVGASLARKRLRDAEQRYARALERELDIGRDIQRGFLPGALPAPAGWELAASFRPARQVAGDFYDAFALPDGRVALVVADVCGKGVGAALFMALVRTLVRAVAGQRFEPDDEAGDGVVATLQATSDYVARTHGEASMFATAFLGALDPATGALDWVNAGHEPAVVLDARGLVRERLAATGPALGLLPDMAFASGRTVLGAGETLVLFTDGVLDARDAAGGEFGEARLLALVGGGDGRRAAAACLTSVTDAVLAHEGGTEPFDDLTMLAARRAEESPA